MTSRDLEVSAYRILCRPGTGGGPSTERDTTVSLPASSPATASFLVWATASDSSSLLLLGLMTKLFTIGKNEVHVLVEGKHLTDEGAPIVDRTFSLQLMRPSIFPPFDFGGGYKANDQIQ